MVLKQLHLFNFKNHELFEEDFSEGINGIVGENGSGKTNVLDAIYCMSMTKSAFFSSDNQLIKDGEKFFAVRGDWSKGQVTVSLKKGENKKVSHNGQACEKMSHHIGKFPIVFIQPDDTELVKDGSEVRRRFVDMMISQLDANYLSQLMAYTKVLKQRNTLLKQCRFTGVIDKDLLEVYDEQLISLNQFLYEQRAFYMQDMEPSVAEFYKLVSGGREEVQLVHQSQCGEATFSEDFRKAYPMDLDRERTTMGVHKDDYIFKIDGKPLKKMGSQGQRKSFVIALQLAKYKVLEAKLGVKPVLLLDDIFDKLDENRIEQLLDLVRSNMFGQIFITDASKERFTRHIERVTSTYNLIEIDRNGKGNSEE